MSSFTKEFADHVSVIVTNCLVFAPDDLSKGVPHAYYHTTNCIWDTGAEITVICPEIAEALGLKEISPWQQNDKQSVILKTTSINNFSKKPKTSATSWRRLGFTLH